MIQQYYVRNVHLVTQPIQKDTICTKVDFTEKVSSNNNTVTVIPHKECNEFDSEQEYELIVNDNIVVI